MGKLFWKNLLTLRKNCYIIEKHVSDSVEVECGYTPWYQGDGGNFYGVCHGLRPGGKFYKFYSTLAQDNHANLGYFNGNNRNTRVRL